MADEATRDARPVGQSPGDPQPFEYSGPPDLAPAVAAALRRVIDPEMALNIVDLGLVYGVDVIDGGARVRITMTSAACPVAEMIVDDVVNELEDLLGDPGKVTCELVWEPPWGPERMSARARSAMGWD
jgi:metal-sulfur cluster biosynthetic enzyme